MDTSSNISNLSESENSIVIGIDLGTRNSCVSIWRNNRTEIIPDSFGNRIIPSIVGFYHSAKLVGFNALALKEVNPLNTIYDVKRIIGRRMTDPSIEQTRKLLSYELVDDQTKHRNILIQLDRSDTSITRKNLYRPEEICAFILSEIRTMASKYTGQNVKKAVITVPAYFNDAQRQATLDSAQIAGLDVLKIINEPTAAVLAYGLANKKWKNKTGGNVIVYDLGAGTLDVSLTNVCDGVFRTLSVGGNTHIGGEDFDYLIMNYLIFEFKKKHSIEEFQISKLAQIKLKNAVEVAKKLLSTSKKATVCVDDFYKNQKLFHVLTREQLEGICNELFVMCMKPIKDVLDSANMTVNDIDEIILVGGSTRIPKIRKLIKDYFKDSPVKDLTISLNPDEIVSSGASIYGYIMTHQSDPFSENLVLLDVTPLSLGVETLRKKMTTIIPRNTTIPSCKKKIFSTDTDDQDTVSIKIFEGERKLTKYNYHVGTFDLTGFDKGPRGYPIIKISFEIDLNGILHVTAHEKRSDVRNSIQITSTWGAKGRLSQKDIEKIISDAQVFEQLDTMYSVKVGLIYEINSICSAIQINLRDKTFNLNKADKKKIKAELNENLLWLKQNDIADMDITELQNRSKYLNETYAPLIVRINKDNDNFTERKSTLTAAEVYGDDDENEGFDMYQQIKNHNNPSEYGKEEINTLKKTISELGYNILAVVNNPVSNFSQEDIELVSDYIGSVNIWIYTTTANTSMEYAAKIDEINKFTENIMKKYDQNSIFKENSEFTVRDELQLTCLTLNTSIKSNYFSLHNDQTEKLSVLINQTLIWLLGHQNEESEVYQAKLNMISDICNEIYQGMRLASDSKNNQTAINNYDDESDSDSEVEEPEPNKKNQITEDIDSILESMQDRPQRRTKNQSPNRKQSSDVLVKVDMNKLCNQTLSYRNSSKSKKKKCVRNIAN